MLSPLFNQIDVCVGFLQIHLQDTTEFEINFLWLVVLYYGSRSQTIISKLKWKVFCIFFFICNITKPKLNFKYLQIREQEFREGRRSFRIVFIIALWPNEGAYMLILKGYNWGLTIHKKTIRQAPIIANRDIHISSHV